LNEKFIEEFATLQAEDSIKATMSQHRDVLGFLQSTNNETASTQDLPDDVYMRTTEILERCFITPLLDRRDSTARDGPLSPIDDPDPDLNREEQTLLYALAQAWELTVIYEEETGDGSLVFKSGAEYGTTINNLLSMVIIHMRKEKQVSTWVVYTVQIIADMQRELGGYLTYTMVRMLRTGQWLKIELDQALFGEDKRQIFPETSLDVIRTFRQQVSTGRQQLAHSPPNTSGNLLEESDRPFYRNVPLVSGTATQLWLETTKRWALASSPRTRLPCTLPTSTTLHRRATSGARRSSR
jgi:hypothetical protein